MNMYHWDWNHWAWPQWTTMILCALSLFATAALHGEDKKPAKHNFPVKLCAVAVGIYIYWAGGFFA